MIRQGTAAVMALLFSTATLGAQGADACSFNSDGSATINNASAAIAAFNATTDRDEQLTSVRTAITALTSEDAQSDETLRAYMLGQALIAYSMIEEAPLVTTRGEIGYTTNADGQVNVLAAVDSAFDAVVAAKPCAEGQVDQMRNIALVRAMNVAVTQFNEGNLDEARSLAQAALGIDNELAPAYHLVGNIDVTERDFDSAFDNFEKAAEYAARDSGYAEIRQSVLMSLGVLAQNRSEELQGAEQQEMAAKSAAYFREHLEHEPDDAAARTGLARALQLSGDTAAVASIYSEILTNAESYDTPELLDAGVTAINDGRDADAAQLLETAYRKSPHSRDVLFALSIAYTGVEEYEKLIPVAKRLIEVDPNNPDNYQLLSQGYQGMVETGERDSRRAFGDSLLRVQQQAASMTERVTFRGLAMSGDDRVLEGDIENLAVEPRTFVINFELLTEDGRVVGTEQVTVSDVAPAGSSPFTVPMQDPSAVHYRYSRIQ